MQLADYILLLMQFNLPSSAGISLKPQHFTDICNNDIPVGWFEIHPENYMSDGGLQHTYLKEIASRFPLSMHGVGMSLGSANGINEEHLFALKKLIDRYHPAQVSEHLSWSHWNQHYLNDLLPLPYTEEALSLTANNILRVQDALKRHILIENPSSYIEYDNNEFDEPEFISSLIKKTDCKLLLDVNNVFVSASNMNFDPYAYLGKIPFTDIKEIHLAGHSIMPLIEGKTIRVDNHGSKVCEEVWKLFEYTIKTAQSKIPTLIEWDTEIPSLEILVEQASTANKVMEKALRENEENS